MPSYTDFAHVYDLLMDDINYDRWLKYYLELTQPTPRSRIVELGCGTGNFSLRLAKMDFEVLGLDLSYRMLGVAQEKARAAGLKPQFARQNIENLDLPRQVPVIIAPCDVVNYLTSLKAVRGCFASVFQNLEPGGRFCFDVSTFGKLLLMDSQMYGEDRVEISYLWFNRFERETNLLQMDLSVFVRQEGGLYRKFYESQLQRAHEIAELSQILTESGFADVQVFSRMTREEPKKGDERVHFLCRKPLR
ncbi:MAG: methyltransferase domain-containing protein [Christensenellaceae bacterium]|jgi:ubiquinone/menaquinone biosynthesis C-methylase UbiE|nr:methyltransferase domain-containing protein [Christensenellaceae bacterium]